MPKKDMIKFLLDEYPEGIVDGMLISELPFEQLQECCRKCLKNDILKKYPTGIMRGRNLEDMPMSQLFQIWKNIKSRFKVIPGQTSLFESIA